MPENPQHSNKSRVKLIESDPNLILKNQLNTSSSKMQYSIPKSQRWNHQQRSASISGFYNLPSLLNSRSTSLGYGKKMDISKKTVVTPPPGTYNFQSQFELKKKGITFGAGRQVVKNVSTFDQKPFKVPGPSQYEIKTIQQTPKYSMKGRNKDLSDRWIKSVPGPGTYNTLELINKDNRTFVSNFQSCPSTSFSRDLRLSEYQKSIKLLKVPGPGQYKIQENRQKIQRFSVQRGKSFSKSQRKGISEKSITPGPGAYSIFSDFIY